MNLLVLFVFLLTSYWVVGRFIVRRWFPGLPPVLSRVAIFFIGTEITVPAVYVLSVLFVKTGQPLLWGTVTMCVIGAIISYFIPDGDIRGLAKIIKATSLSDWILVVFALMFASWVMVKTFHGGLNGELFVGSNNVFDFGLGVGLMRSISWGSNIPFMSPFFAGMPMFYHFLFDFWTGMWGYFGIPTVWAVNIPSILSFSAFLLVIYYLPQVLLKQKPIVGFITVLLTITNSSLTFWNLLGSHGMTIQFWKYLWRLPTYPFAGPFDGSTISIYLTLNNFVNQRHLAFALATGILLIMLAIRDSTEKRMTGAKSIIYGILTGVMMLWNTLLIFLVAFVIALLLGLTKKWKWLGVYVVSVAVMALVGLSPLLRFIPQIVTLLHVLNSSAVSAKLPTWTFPEYLWQNLGILPIVAVAGVFLIPKKKRTYGIPFVILLIVELVYAAIRKHGFEQKSLSFLMPWVNVCAAVAVGRVWRKTKLVAVVMLFILTVSGVVDLFPIKNEFAYPLVGADTVPVISWIHTHTPPTSVFVSYADIVDPVALAGRTNYFGFFGNIGDGDRSPEVKRIYDGDVALAKKLGISYILVPRWVKPSFPYMVNLELPVIYQDARFTVYAVK